MKELIKRNKNFMMMLLYIGLLLFILIKIYDLNNFSFLKESFHDNRGRDSTDYMKKIPHTKIKFFIRTSLIDYNDAVKGTTPATDTIRTQATKRYFGVFNPNEEDYKKKNIPNELYTVTAPTDEWDFIPNSQIDQNKIISDLTYDKNKNMMAVSLHIDKGKPIYNIYRTPITKLEELRKSSAKKSKTTTSSMSKPFESIWELMGENIGMRSLFYDNVEEYWVGVSSYDGQIYHNKNNDFNTWEGPIDIPNKEKVPVRKIMYADDGKLMGIGLIDNYIYKKKTTKWRESEWDLDYTNNKQKVYDIMYDTDGKMIVSTRDGIKKQNDQGFDSEFGQYKASPSNTDLVEPKDVLYYRTGVYFIEDYFNNDTDLGEKLEELYKFKKLTKKLCSARTKYLSKEIESDNQILPDDISKQNNDIGLLYNTIDGLFDKLNKETPMTNKKSDDGLRK